ncbi:MAG: hypothetical protein R3C69_08605 [Geminicoccaceae bacterium]
MAPITVSLFELPADAWRANHQRTMPASTFALAGHPACVVGGQEGHGVGDLRRLALARHGLRISTKAKASLCGLAFTPSD